MAAREIAVSVVFVVLPVSILLALVAVVLFVLSVRRGQLDDLDTPALRMLPDDEPVDADDEAADRDARDDAPPDGGR